MRATVSIRERADGPDVVIEYEDGHTVRIAAGGPDSIVLRMYLDLGDEPAGEPGR